MKYTLIKDAEDLRFLTVKAAKCIAEAQFLVVDSAISDEINELVPVNSFKLHINELRSYLSARPDRLPSNIVHISGNDTDISEEEGSIVCYLKGIGYQLSIIPGVNVVNRIAGQNHFPLTIRNRNESFWVCDARFFYPSVKEMIEKIHAVASSNAAMAIKHINIDALRFMATIISIYRHQETPVLVNDFGGGVDCYTLMEIQDRLAEDQYKLVVINPCVRMLKAAAFSVEEVLESRLATG